MPQQSGIVASWSDTGNVYIFDITQHFEALDVPPTTKLKNVEPLQSFSGHPNEGFAIDWSPTVPGRLITGDCTKFIYLWEMQTGTCKWEINFAPFSAHTNSVEDLQWSPSEADVFASCSVDRTVKIWDVRSKKAVLSVEAHASDVNVISWNKKMQYLLASGSDDGSFNVWDLRNFKSSSPVGHFKYHSGAITSLEWNPAEDSVLGVASADDQVTLWDLSLERDPESDAIEDIDVPPQLLFVHQGQKDLKELHFHSQIPGLIITTAEDGFNVFKTINV